MFNFAVGVYRLMLVLSVVHISIFKPFFFISLHIFKFSAS